MKTYPHKYLPIALLLMLAMVSSSCKKFLEKGPIDATYSNVFWTSQAAVEQASNAMYSQLRSSLRSGSSFFVLGDFTTGAYNTIEWNLNVRAGASPPFNFSYVPYREGDLQNWSRFYRIIAQANLLLEQVPAMPAAAFTSEAVRKAYIADALFVRAFTYFFMIRVWGDPVYVSKTYNDVDYGKIPPIARTPETKVIDSCLRDLKVAGSSMSFGGGNATLATKGNKGSVYALMAHLYAWKHHYDSTNYYCQELINQGGYQLEPMSSYKNIWAGQASSESIFEIPMQFSASDPNDPDQNESAEASFDFFATWLKGVDVDKNRENCWIMPEGGMLESLFDTANDKRFKAVTLRMPASNRDVAGNMMMKYSNFIYQVPDKKQLPFINNNLVIFRLSDIYLLNAEALAFKGNLIAAKTYLAATEDRAGINNYTGINSQYELIDEVIIERGRELMGEGQWFYDMIRTNKAQGWLEYVGYPTERTKLENKGYYWPLDMATLFPQNTLLTQNPWWAKNK